MKPYRFENAPLLKAFSKRPGSDNELDRRRVNERCNCIETDAVTNETRCPCKQCLTVPDTIMTEIHSFYSELYDEKPGIQGDYLTCPFLEDTLSSPKLTEGLDGVN